MECLSLTFHFDHCSLFLVRLLEMIEFSRQYCVNDVPHVSFTLFQHLELVFREMFSDKIHEGNYSPVC